MPELFVEGVAVVGIARPAHGAEQPTAFARGCDARLVAKPIFFAGLALGDAANLRFMHAVDLVFVGGLLRMDALRGRQESLESAGRLGWLAEDFPDHPTQVGAQFPGAGPGPLHLPGVGVATLLHEQSGTDSFVALLDLDPALPRLFHQTLPCTVVEPGIGRVAHRFGLHRRIHIDPLELGGRDHLQPQSGLDRFLEHRFRASFAEAVAPPRNAGGINGISCWKNCSPLKYCQ